MSKRNDIQIKKLKEYSELENRDKKTGRAEEMQGEGGQSHTSSAKHDELIPTKSTIVDGFAIVQLDEGEKYEDGNSRQ